MRKLKIALGDLAYFTQGNIHNLYVPLNIGYIAAYVQHLYPGATEVQLHKDPAKFLAYVRDEQPDIIGLSLYYWNANLNGLALRRIRAMTTELWRPSVVFGGPCIDADPTEQLNMLKRYPGLDAIIPNEGEAGFAAVTGAHLAGDLWQQPLPGVVFRNGEQLIKGPPIGLQTDLAKVPSPYLIGLLDDYLGGMYKPMIQTSRLCPYTCAFCVSGKDRGKMRAFSPDLVRDETAYIAKRFQGDKDTLFYLTDENFGIMERDLEVADYILGVRDQYGYPNRVYFYNDKRFTHIARGVHEKFGKMVWHGVCLSLQSENPETLKAIRRRNLTDEQVTAALAWAKGLGLKTSTELIFGMPMETRASFMALLDKCARWGFDVINCYSLMIFDGIEMNRRNYRDEHRLQTQRRLNRSNATMIDGEFCVETEEIAVSSKSFTFEDFKLIYKLNFMFSAIFISGVQRPFIDALVASGMSLTGFLIEFLTPTEGNDEISEQHRQFLQEIDQTVVEQLYDETNFPEIADRARYQLIDMSGSTAAKGADPERGRRWVTPDAPWVDTMFARTFSKLEAIDGQLTSPVAVSAAM